MPSVEGGMPSVEGGMPSLRATRPRPGAVHNKQGGPRVDADVIVVGAGAAGASAAYFLRQQGLRVLVLEKKKLPRYKTCAGGLPARVLKYFPFSLEQVLEQEVRKATFVWKSRQVTHLVPAKRLYMVMRDKFDYALLQKSGAEVCEGRRVLQVQTAKQNAQVRLDNGCQLSSRFVLGADGANSRVAQSLGLRQNRRYSIALEAEVVPEAGIMASFAERLLIGLEVPDKGYYWIFPKQDHLSVGLGSLLNKQKGLHRLLISVMARYGLNLDKREVRARPLPLPVSGERLQQGRVLLLGDAAGLVDPLTGEGIRHAVQSARLASELILAGGWDRYSQRVQAEISGDLYWARVLACLFYGLQGFGFEYLVRNASIFQDILKVMNGQMGYKQGFFRLPSYLWSGIRKTALDV